MQNIQRHAEEQRQRIGKHDEKFEALDRKVDKIDVVAMQMEQVKQNQCEANRRLEEMLQSQQNLTENLKAENEQLRKLVHEATSQMRDLKLQQSQMSESQVQPP